MELKAVLFDFDYTLGDATDSIVAGFQYAMPALGWPAPDRETVRRTVGYLLSDSYTMLTGDSDPDRVARFLELYLEKAADLQIATTVLFPGAYELLEALHSRGVRLGVVSSKRRASLEPSLKRLGLLPMLDVLIAGDMVQAPKPDPEGLIRGCAELKLTPEEILFCGDTVLDAGAAQRAGSHFCAVLNGTTQKEAFASYPCDYIAASLWQLKDWLDV